MTPTGSTIRILVVDDHPLLREGLGAMIAGQADMALVAEAENGEQALSAFRAHQPDITLMDVRMPTMGGIDAITAIRAEFPAARIIVLTTYEGDAQALRAIKAGAAGYLLKSMLRKELVETIRSVHAGRRRIAADIASELAEHVADDELTVRERDVLALVAVGNANKEVAARMGISEETVKTHMKNVLTKLGARDRTHAVVVALKRGIIDI
ncbi:response regulator transcription factor [Pyxidicoccus fallax]|uniref:Response regulator transcription factor n=1 Tax=Pyxidicoccus fallax TaxID=394095 RepID=A0A848L9K5_9BACT|nr:response regulator transcription factor [Pyxidicoccus fallax]NMO15710.1 response regulator transcription factor [Pyxidicoccus fallax]NPC77117.1 response regulator transcription factor [Pyxidicoccus fallax]